MSVTMDDNQTMDGAAQERVGAGHLAGKNDGGGGESGPSEIDASIEDGKKGMENALRANSLELKRATCETAQRTAGRAGK